jgi:ketosteroid isomerase-like protein
MQFLRHAASGARARNPDSHLSCRAAGSRQPEEEPMTTREVGEKLVALCRQNKPYEAMETLYDPKIVSVEAVPMESGQREVRGLEGCIAKGKDFDSRFEVHSAVAEGPYPHDDRFAVFFKYETTHKPSGQRMTLDEIALYTVKDGKIVREEFFYAPPPG